jgi:integrase
MVQSSVSTADSKTVKPEKPAGCPLFPHASGRWAKKINQQTHYFGPWRDLAGALAKYEREKDDLKAGRKPTAADAAGLSVMDLCNKFLTTKRHLADTREITEGSFRDYYATCARLLSAFGKTRLVDDLAAEDFEHLRKEIAKTRGPVALGNEIGRVRMVFKYASDNRLVDRPVAYGQGFNKPSKKVLRKEKAARGPKDFQADELRLLIGKAGVPLKAMVLLGINAALGQTDVANLPMAALDLKGGWLNYPRGKTGIDRHCPLWTETIEAIHAALAERPTPQNPEDKELVFITEPGNRWVRVLKSGKPGDDTDPEKWVNIDSVSLQFRKLMKACDLNGHRNFYCLRRTFETQGSEVPDDQSPDQAAIDAIMGHAPDSDDMGAIYRQRISDKRLLRVTSNLHDWLFPVKSDR